MTKMENSVYVLEKRYDIKQQSDMFNLDRDVMILTSLGAVLSITVGSRIIILKMFDRDPESTAYLTASRYGFEEV